MASAIVPLPARAQSTELAGTGAVEYRLVHKFHKFTGRSKAMVVRGAVDAGGLKAMARAQVGTFDSDNTNRDEHMMETVEGTKYPWVTVRVAAMGYKLPTSPSTAKLVVQGAVELHGVTVNHPIELGVETQDGVHFRVHFEFVESLTAHKIERPSLLFMPVDDTITIVGSAEITAKR
ncbi:MAG: YceI family protein [Polyangia bacterium]